MAPAGAAHSPMPDCEDRVLDGPASGEKGSKGRNELDCIRGKGVRALIVFFFITPQPRVELYTSL